ncbi:MAG: hypothetical protein HYX79_06775 [Chloroflexi bacterium]|nr:hypothetical protein [Chloroflexota bacterium]
MKKTEGGQTILYINKYYEKNLTTGVITTYYYLGGRLVAKLSGETLSYVHQDHLTGTALTTDNSGAQVGAIRYFPFGDRRNSTGNLGTDKLFTGQRLDGTGLYYYNARYYDAEIGRFISADTFVQDYSNPQNFNKYSYVLNNPLRYVDRSGNLTAPPPPITIPQPLPPDPGDPPTGSSPEPTAPPPSLPVTPAPAPPSGNPTLPESSPSPAAPPTMPGTSPGSGSQGGGITPQQMGNLLASAAGLAANFILGLNVFKAATATTMRASLSVAGLHLGWAADIGAVGTGGQDRVGQILNVASAVTAPLVLFGLPGMIVAGAVSGAALIYTVATIRRK